MRELRSELIEQLSASIRERGLLQPIVLSPFGSRFKLVAGHHRLEAVKRLGGHLTVKALVLEDTDADQVLLAEIDENLIRAELSPEVARGKIADVGDAVATSLDSPDELDALAKPPESVQRDPIAQAKKASASPPRRAWSRARKIHQVGRPRGHGYPFHRADLRPLAQDQQQSPETLRQDVRRGGRSRQARQVLRRPRAAQAEGCAMNERRDLPPLRALRRLGYPDERLLAVWQQDRKRALDLRSGKMEPTP
jgi:hypothetical protein